LRLTEIKRRVERMMSALKLSGVEVSVLLTGDVQMRELNRLYRKKDRTTDVLAFPMSDEREPKPTLLGDVIVSIPTARAQAKGAGRPLVEEVTMLLAHGLLHLLGWDHVTPEEDRAMRNETSRLCVIAKGAESRHTRAQRRLGGRRKLS
jgi:probable rRNA maturation factor